MKGLLYQLAHSGFNSSILPAGYGDGGPASGRASAGMTGSRLCGHLQHSG